MLHAPIPAAVLVSALLTGQQQAAQPQPGGADADFLTAIGPLERRANPVSPENPVPRRVLYSPPVYPLEAAVHNARGTFTLRLTLDDLGRVEEARVVLMALKTDGYSVSSSGDGADAAFGRSLLGGDPGVAAAARSVALAFIRSAASAVRQWRYDPPFKAPISFNVTVSFSPDGVERGENAAGTEARTPPAPTPPRTDDGAIRVGGAIGPPAKTKDVRPVYPPEAKAQNVQGVVIVEIRIDEEGRVSDARVLRSIPLLDQAALDAVRQWEFTPTLLNGVPTPVVMTVTLNFTLMQV